MKVSTRPETPTRPAPEPRASGAGDTPLALRSGAHPPRRRHPLLYLGGGRDKTTLREGEYATRNPNQTSSRASSLRGGGYSTRPQEWG
eukprot:CAMPEP_0204315536 /NCGR_PEP_ID=MMETSP0469-20131031/4897_1 /ASSEMBLY_ACC=CAM_ASM_000384 /TAXON_ID=2969 /ORGANISM="Oxyrrhis marina" /LENGTH=87 /DNA_ID=CAMNT_0051296215 /DNA_START=17 /DNA_END=276 /DNA_ORIENTATION=+